MTGLRLLLYVCLAIAPSTSCNTASPPPTAPQVSASAVKRYRLKGKVVSLDMRAKMANIDSEAIPDFMDAMTMAYRVKPESELEKLKPGDAITADLIVQDENYWLESIAITAHGH